MWYSVIVVEQRFSFLPDYDECKENDPKCGANADCINTQGSYTCRCKEGYMGDGYNCTSKSLLPQLFGVVLSIYETLLDHVSFPGVLFITLNKILFITYGSMLTCSLFSKQHSPIVSQTLT